jgi:hypothetical protein
MTDHEFYFIFYFTYREPWQVDCGSVVAVEGWIQVLGEAGGGGTAAAAKQQLACGAAGQPAQDPRGGQRAELSPQAQNTRSAARASPLQGRGEEGRT